MIGCVVNVGRTYKVAVVASLPASLTTIHVYSPPSCVALIDDKLNVVPFSIINEETKLNTVETSIGRCVIADCSSELIFVRVTLDLIHANTLLGPPPAEHVNVTLLPLSTVTSCGEIIELPSGDTIQNSIKVVT